MPTKLECWRINDLGPSKSTILAHLGAQSNRRQVISFLEATANPITNNQQLNQCSTELDKNKWKKKGRATAIHLPIEHFIKCSQN